VPEPDSGPELTAATLGFDHCDGPLDAVSQLGLGHVGAASLTAKVVFLGVVAAPGSVRDRSSALRGPS
jgi:hypothetical protein